MSPTEDAIRDAVKVARGCDELREATQELENQFGDSQAAVRLLQGAFLVGDIQEQRYQTALAELQKVEHKAAGIPIGDHVRRLSAARTKAAPKLKPKTAEAQKAFDSRPPNELLTWPEGTHHLLVADNRFVEGGWKVFFNTILPDQVVSALNENTVKTKVTDPNTRIGLVFLAMQLDGQSEFSGLELLKWLRREHPDLPVVAFTRLHSTTLNRYAMQLGAADFFVKELPDEKDRSAIGYYLKLKELFYQHRARPFWRVAWQRLKRLRNFKTDGLSPDLTGLVESVRRHLCLAYYFLTSERADPQLAVALANTIPQNDILLSHCAAELGLAVERMVLEHSRRRGDSDDQQTTFQDRLNRLVRADLIPSDGPARKVWEYRNRAVHPHPTPPTLNELEHGFLWTIDLVGSLLDSLLRCDPNVPK